MALPAIPPKPPWPSAAQRNRPNQRQNQSTYCPYQATPTAPKSIHRRPRQQTVFHRLPILIPVHTLTAYPYTSPYQPLAASQTNQSIPVHHNLNPRQRQQPQSIPVQPVHNHMPNQPITIC
ncbi:unnamed protein product [Ilex paraguariensis]|uniref:Uncharacterized protein n=1 Tax=Ilex paraguariensis TaxID=185542 RepID=A0ABC8QKT9_9AQUA